MPSSICLTRLSAKERMNIEQAIDGPGRAGGKRRGRPARAGRKREKNRAMSAEGAGTGETVARFNLSCSRQTHPFEASRPGTRIAMTAGMSITARVTFHQLPPSPALEEDIRKRFAELEGISDRIVDCRVVVEAPHRHHHQGQLFRVGIELGVPGEHLVVGRAPDAHHSHEDAHVAVRDAFQAIRRQLEDHLRRQRGDVKAHSRPAAGGEI
jgi:ribosome-associated translation inhibitor RaiA